MNAARWKYLKALRPQAPRYVHVSAEVGMIPHPTDPLMPATPYVAPGVTFDRNRNKTKEMRRALAKRA